MATALDDVRVEVAFSADPNTTSPAFVDLTSRAKMVSSIGIQRGRSEDFDEVQVGQCSLTLDNTDGALTAGRAASPYYPNVKPQNRLRVSYRDQTVDGNLLTANQASMETDSSDWQGNTFFGSQTLPQSITNSAVRAWTGTKSTLVTWPTTAIPSSATTTFATVVGRTYTFSVYVYVPTGSPNVQVQAAFLSNSAFTSVKDAWVRLSTTFVATNNLVFVCVTAGSATAGQQCWFDGAQLDEGPNVRTFTTTPAPIVYRFDGYVDRWPTEWPGGGDTEAVAQVTAYDLQARISKTRKLQSVISETVRSKTALWYFPLDEDADSTSVGDRVGAGSTLAPVQVGTGGALTFDGSTGPPTDGNGAPLFAPASAGNGLYLTGAVPAGSGFFAPGCVLQAAVRTSTATRAMTVARWNDAWGTMITLGFDATGHATCTAYNPWIPSLAMTVTSTQVYADNQTHVMSAEVVLTSSTVWNLSLYVDGVSRGTPLAQNWGAFMADLSYLNVGGTPGNADLFAGTISHVAGYFTAPTAGDRTEIVQSMTTGFAGERSDQRIARIAKWVGIPTALQSLDVGVSTIAHVDCTGKGAWEYMQDVATTEAGLLFISTDGKLSFYARTRSYDAAAAVDVTLPATVVSPDVAIATDVADVVNDVTVTRAGGATVRVFDASSQSSYGILEDSLELISSTDSDAFNRANWILGLKSQPMPRLPQLNVDALAEPNTAAAARRLDLSRRIALTGMPSQASSSTYDLRVQGYSETISDTGWDIVVNTTPFLLVQPMIADDPVYGKADSNNRAVY